MFVGETLGEKDKNNKKYLNYNCNSATNRRWLVRFVANSPQFKHVNLYNS